MRRPTLPGRSPVPEPSPTPGHLPSPERSPSLGRSPLPGRPAFPDRRTLARYALCYALAALGAALFALAGVPLPWMLGALVFAAAGRLAGLPVLASRRGRNVGALVIGCALGLYFTPATAARLSADAPLAAAVALLTIAAGLALSPLMARLGGLDRRTALFASVPGGVSDMAILGESYGAKPAAIAAAQLLRLVGTVVMVPAGLAILGGLHRGAAERAVLPTHAPGLLLLVALGGLGTWALTRLGVRNAWLLGGLAVSLAFTATGHALSGVPNWVVAAAQIFLGAQLGTQFERATFVGGRRLLGAAALNIVLLALACAAIGAALSWASGASAGTAVLAAAPGGVAEMSITARAMSLDVAMVAAFHVVRIFLTAALIQPLCWLYARLGRF